MARSHNSPGHDPRRWSLPSRLLAFWGGMVAVAAVAVWWCARQPTAVGVPCLLVVLFAEGLAALLLFAAAARGIAADVRADLVTRLDALASAVEGVDAGLRAVSSRIGVGETALADRRAVRESAELVRGELATACRGLTQSIALVRQEIGDGTTQLAGAISRARHDIEDGKVLLVDLIRGPDALAAPGTISAGGRSDGE